MKSIPTSQIPQPCSSNPHRTIETKPAIIQTIQFAFNCVRYVISFSNSQINQAIHSNLTSHRWLRRWALILDIIVPLRGAFALALWWVFAWLLRWAFALAFTGGFCLGLCGGLLRWLCLCCAGVVALCGGPLLSFRLGLCGCGAGVRFALCCGWAACLAL